MKIVRLNIDGFRNLQFLEVPVVDNVTLLCGPNSSGKTAALDAIMQVMQFSGFKSDDLPRKKVRDSFEIRMVLELLESEQSLADIWMPDAPADQLDLRLVVTPAAPQLRVRSVRARRRKEKKWIDIVRDSGHGDLAAIGMGGSDAVSRTLARIRDHANSSWFRLRHDRAPAARNNLGEVLRLTSNAAELPGRLHTIQSNDPERFLLFQQKVHTILPDAGLLRARIRGPEVVLRFTKEDGDHDLDSVGAGISHLLAILLLLEEPYTNGNLLLIDEPETSLHPAAQRSLAEMVAQSGAQTLIATHSPVFVQRFGPNTLVHRNGRFVPLATDSTGLLEMGIRPSDLASHDALVLLEGPSDVETMRALGQVLQCRWDVKRVGLLPMGTGSRGAVRHSLSILAGLSKWAIPTLVVIDRDERSRQEIGALIKLPNVVVLSRRELENYFILPSSLTKVLGTPYDYSRIHEDLKSLPLGVLAESIWKRIRAEHGELHSAAIPYDLPPGQDWGSIQDLSPRLVATIEASSFQFHRQRENIAKTIEDVSSTLTAAWEDPTLRLKLFPGAELLAHIFSKNGRAYKKTRDAAALAQAVAPDEIDNELRTIAGRISALTPHA